MKIGVAFIFFFFTTLLNFAQGEGNHWYFGYNAGLDFTSGNPVPDLNGALSTWEGCSSVSDKNGNLLFYTDGSSAYTRNHTIMPNGTGLLGNSSSAQSAIIVKKPGTDTLFYVFTTPDASSGGFYYSEVNMALNGGLGDIVLATKNTNLLPVVGERLTAMKHSNGVFTWVVTKASNTTDYYAYLVDCNGVQSPVITSVGLNAAGGNYGATAVSPNGKKIASTFFGSFNAIEILDFNNSTGIFSNPITQLQAAYPYGACFSPNSNLLYFSNINNGNVTQLDLNAGGGSAAAVLASTTIVGNFPIASSPYGFRSGALQIAPNGKIYLAEDEQPNISVINNPNVLGVGCNFVADAVSLGGKTCRLGLPAFFLNFLDTTIINYDHTCISSPISFSINGDSTAIDSVHWDFGDIASGTNNYSSDYAPLHTYSSANNYTVRLIRYFLCGSDTSNIEITIVPNTVVATAIGTNSVCLGDTVELTASGASFYDWTGPSNFTDTSQAININNAVNSGTYIVTVSDINGCSDTATVTVSVYPLPVATAISNSPVPLGSFINLSTDTMSGIAWSGPNSFTGNQQNPTIANAQLNHSGTYQVIKTNIYGCSDTAEVFVSVYQPEIPDNGIDDDSDNLIDCADPDLATLSQCYRCGYDSVGWKTVIPESGFNKGIAVKYTGYDQFFTVPAGVTSIKVKAWGAGGGGGYTAYNVAAGAGGFTVDQFGTASGETYIVVAGEGGWATRHINQTARATFGFGGSGNSLGSAATSETGSGGGLSGVFYSAATQANARVIAGGGGGIADTDGLDETSGGNGNNPLSGGYLPLTGQNAPANSKGFGGGGGGYVGGISGISRFSFAGHLPETSADGGEGGSGFKYTSGGQIKFTPELNIYPPDTADLHYIQGVGVGNDYDMAIGASGDIKTGGNGLVVIQWFEPLADLIATASKISICNGDTLSIIATGPGTYLWSPSVSLNNSTSAQVIATPVSDITYQVISNNNNCMDTAEVQIVVHPLPVLTLTSDTSICLSDSLQLNVTGASIYSWLPGTGLNVVSGSTVIASPLITTQYYVTGTDTNNCSVMDSVLLTIDTLPIAVITGTTGICYSDSTVLMASGGTSYLWSNGQTNASITATPLSDTNYFVVVENINGCIDTASVDIIVHHLPNPQFFAPNVCDGNNVLFNNLSVISNPDTIQSYTWNFGDGAALNSAASPSHLFMNDSAYAVRLIVISSFGCADSIIKTITTNPNPEVSFTVNDTIGCALLCVSFQDLSSLNTGANTHWLWDYGDGSPFDTAANPNHCYSNNFSPESYNVTLTVTSDSGCISSFSKNNYVTLHPNPVAQFSTANVCEGENVLFADLSSVPATDSIQSWEWSFGDGSPVNATPSVSGGHLYSSASTYTTTLKVVSNFGCIDSVAKAVVVNPKPMVNFTASDTAGCEPLCIAFQNSAPIATSVQWVWNTGDGGAEVSSQSFDHCYQNDSVSTSNTFDVTLTVITDSGCVNSLSKNDYIIVYPNPDAVFTTMPQTTTITDPVISIADLSAGATLWSWDFGDTQTSVLSNPTTHSYTDTGAYTIELAASNQYNCADTAYQTIRIEPDFLFYIPNAFSPNDDGINDTFVGKGVFVKEFEMYIFDRWGNLVYKSDNINKPWGGKINQGEEIAQGDVYVYAIKAIDIFGKIHKYRGTVTLVK